MVTNLPWETASERQSQKGNCSVRLCTAGLPHGYTSLQRDASTLNECKGQAVILKIALECYADDGHSCHTWKQCSAKQQAEGAWGILYTSDWLRPMKVAWNWSTTTFYTQQPNTPCSRHALSTCQGCAMLCLLCLACEKSNLYLDWHWGLPEDVPSQSQIGPQSEHALHCCTHAVLCMLCRQL